MNDLLDSYSRMKLLEMARSDYDVDGIIARADKLAAWTTGQKAAIGTYVGEPVAKDEAAVSFAQLETEFPVLKEGTMFATGDKVLQFPDKETVAKDDPDAKPARKPRSPNKLKAAKGKRGKPAKVKASDTGDAPGDAPATAPVPNGAAPHIDPPHEVEQPPMAA